MGGRVSYELRLGSCLDPVTGLASLADDSVDALVTDPPAGIGFMGKEWDSDKGGRDKWIAWLAEVMAGCLRVLKPGAHGLVWALPRTSHWTATACENAGFEIRDVHHHLFGTGFPKSLTHNSAEIPEWSGTALKPAAEHWILVRKPLVASVADTYAEHGTGVLNIGGCRIGTTKEVPTSAPKDRVNLAKGAERGRTMETIGFDPNVGRWPANVSLDEFAASVLDEQSGVQRDGVAVNRNRTERLPSPTGFAPKLISGGDFTHGGAGGASRFFFVAKGSRSEKDAGLEGMVKRTGGEATGRVDGSAGTNNPRAGSGRTGGARNFHPTVKGIELMRWLVRLVTPPGGLVLDAFAGSGTTGVACIEEGARFIGFEISAEYHEIATARLGAASRQLSLFSPKPAQQDEAKPRPEQPGLFSWGQ